jgi:hypothetical protein
MKAPDLGRRGCVDNSPLISCEGVRERHLSFTQYPLTVGVCAKLLIRHEKSWPGSDSGQLVPSAVAARSAKMVAPVAEASEKLAAERAEFDGLVERMQAELAALGLSFWLPRNLTRCIR